MRRGRRTWAPACFRCCTPAARLDLVADCFPTYIYAIYCFIAGDGTPVTICRSSVWRPSFFELPGAAWAAVV